MLFPGDRGVLWHGSMQSFLDFLGLGSQHRREAYPNSPSQGGSLLFFLLPPPYLKDPLPNCHSFPPMLKALPVLFNCPPPSLALSPGGPDCTRGSVLGMPLEAFALMALWA